MSNLAKERIKIPSNFSIKGYKNFLLIRSSLGCKKIKFYNQILIENNEIIITDKLLKNFLKFKDLKAKACRGTLWSSLKQLFLDMSSGVYKSLVLVGVGYRANVIKVSNFQVLELKLGYSHPIKIRIFEDLKVKCPDVNKIFIFGFDKRRVTQLAAHIKSYKIPEPYKGKGILDRFEKVKIKEGKRS